MTVTLSLPSWINEAVDSDKRYTSDEDKVRLAIRLSRLNVEQKTGGPFGAAIFNDLTGQLVSVGVNRVVPETCSVAHAEMMAYMLAEAELGHYRLNVNEQNRHVLASSAQPCSMCYGALPWTGIQRLIFAARGSDVESLTDFDEGPMPKDWEEQLGNRDITVESGILREEACDILRRYHRSQGISY